MKKLVIGLVILIVALIIYFITSTNTNDDNKTTSNPQDMYSCSKDSDCIVVQDGWCEYIVGINKEFEEVWRQQNEKSTIEAKQMRMLCGGLAPWETLEYANPFCNQGRCDIGYDQNIINKLSQ